MIIYDLSCENGHAFEGWFKSPDDFESQLQRGLISCPNCASIEVRRIPSAVHLGKTEKSSAASELVQTEQAGSTEQISLPVEQSTAQIQEDATAAMRRLVSMINEKCENVGNNFAEEARKIHYAEAPVRPIRGEVSQKEFHELHDEGIDVFIMPRIKNNNLM